MFQTKVVEEIKTHFMFNNFFPRKSCRLWDNVEKHGTARRATDDSITRRMRFACWITKATDTQSEYAIHCFSTATMVTRKLLNVTLHIECPSCYSVDMMSLNDGCLIASTEFQHCVSYADGWRLKQVKQVYRLMKYEGEVSCGIRRKFEGKVILYGCSFSLPKCVWV